MHSQQSISQSDEELWMQMKDGDKKSLRILFLRYYDSLFKYGLTVSSKESVIKDCLQELFFQLWETHHHLSLVHNVKSYLWISFRRRLMKQLQKKGRRNNLSTPFSVGTKTVSGIEQVMIHDEEQAQNHKALHKALEKLSQREREVLFLKYYEGMSYSEIEQILEVEYQTARNYMYRAIERLRKSLQKEEVNIVLSAFFAFGLW